ncbi:MULTISPECIES: antibiotic biosynthesis monooxygenase [unclassified Frankia]|uniref:antibiotic biosynthesis monooxygenase family protein n=1 Tax=unclassified Frankia TaxID=2632575 RepID=UPI001EF74863|nr:MULTISPECIES: antibiotic biosynthesis monooxygenase family protein [unclassified Frankia]
MIRVTLTMRVRPNREQDFIDVWEKVALAASRATGNLRQSLLRDGPCAFVITSDWTDREHFQAFERSPEQDALTAPLRDLRESVRMEVAEILVHLEGTEWRS